MITIGLQRQVALHLTALIVGARALAMVDGELLTCQDRAFDSPMLPPD